MVDREARGRTARFDTQLGVDGLKMPTDGAPAEHKLLGHLGIGQPGGDQTQHVNLALGQTGRIVRCRCALRSWPERGDCVKRIWLGQRIGDDLREQNCASLGPIVGVARKRCWNVPFICRAMM